MSVYLSDGTLASNHLVQNPGNLQTAIQAGDSLRVSTVLQDNAVNQPLPNGRLPLHLAVLENQPEVVTNLLAKGANPELRDAHGFNAFDHASFMKNKEITAILLGKVIGMYPDYIDGLLKNPVSTSEMKALKAKTDKLLEVKVNKLTSLCRAAFEGNLEEIKKLAPKEINKLDKFGRSPVHYAVLGNQTRALALLIAKGGNIEALTATGDSALHLAALTGSTSLIKQLINDLGFNANETNEQGQAPLHYAAVQEKFTAIHSLITLGARPTLQDESGISPLSLIGTSALQRDPLALSKTQVLLFALSAAYWVYHLTQALGWEPEAFLSEEVLLGASGVTRQFSALFSGSWATFGAQLLGNALLFKELAVGSANAIREALAISMTLFQAFHTFDVVTSAFKGLKACWDHWGFRNWKVARNVVVHTTNIASTVSTLLPAVQEAVNYYRAVNAKTLPEVDRILSPYLDPTKPEGARSILCPDCDTPEEVVKAYRKLTLKYHPDKVKDLSREVAASISERLNLAKQTLKGEEHLLPLS